MGVHSHFACVDGRAGRVGQQVQTGRRSGVLAGHAALRRQRRARPGVGRLAQPSFEEIFHLAPLLLHHLHIWRLHHHSALLAKPLGSWQGGVSARHDGGGRLHVPPLPPCHTILQLAKSRAGFVLHGEVEHAGRHVVASELDRHLKFTALLLLSPRLGVELEPSGATEEKKTVNLTLLL